MQKHHLKFIKIPKRLVPLIVLLLVLLGLSLLIVAWYNRKIAGMQDEEKRIEKSLSVL